MSPRAFLVLLCVTLASVALAGWAVATRDLPVATLTVDQPFLPDLAQKIDQVAEITVRTAERSATARRTAQGWVLAEAADYPVDPEQVRGIVLGLAEMRLVEARTDNPERLTRLELEPVDRKDAKSRLVTLRDAQGGVLAEVVLGKRKFSLYGPGKAGMYVRLADSNQAWLADRAIEIPNEPLDWLDRTILDLPKDRLAEVILQPDTPEAATIRRVEGQGEFILIDLPEGRSPASDKIERVVSAFAALSMTDIAQRATKELPEPIGRAVYRSREGAEIAVAVSRLGEGDEAEWWLALEARGGTPQGTAAPPAQGGASSAHSKPALDPEALARRFAGRVFKVSRYVAERFTWKRDDLLAPAAAREGS